MIIIGSEFLNWNNKNTSEEKAVIAVAAVCDCLASVLTKSNFKWLPSFIKPLLRYRKYYMVYEWCQNDVGYLKYCLIRQMFYTWEKQKCL